MSRRSPTGEGGPISASACPHGSRPRIPGGIRRGSCSCTRPSTRIRATTHRRRRDSRRGGQGRTDRGRGDPRHPFPPIAVSARKRRILVAAEHARVPPVVAPALPEPVVANSIEPLATASWRLYGGRVTFSKFSALPQCDLIPSTKASICLSVSGPPACCAKAGALVPGTPCAIIVRKVAVLARAR